MKKLIGLLFLGLLCVVMANESYYKNGKLVELINTHNIRATTGVDVNYYKTQKGKKVGIRDQILVQCKENIDCEKLLKSYKLFNYRKITQKIFVVKIENYDEIFLLSRKLFESGDVQFAHPNFIKERKKR